MKALFLTDGQFETLNHLLADISVRDELGEYENLTKAVKDKTPIQWVLDCDRSRYKVYVLRDGREIYSTELKT